MWNSGSRPLISVCVLGCFELIKNARMLSALPHRPHPCRPTHPQLVDATTGETVQLSSYAAGAPATLIMVLSRHCLFVVHLKAAIAQLARDYQAKGVKVLAVGSNSVETHPQDGPEGMAQDVKEYNFSFPYLFDEASNGCWEHGDGFCTCTFLGEQSWMSGSPLPPTRAPWALPQLQTQDVAKAYKAACTPEFYVFDSNLRLTYHGQARRAWPLMPAERPARTPPPAALLGRQRCWPTCPVA